VRELIASLDGCTGGQAGEIVAAAGMPRKLCGEANREQARKLLIAARAYARPVSPRRLAAVGTDLFVKDPSAIRSGSVGFEAEPRAEIPIVVEAWVDPTSGMMLTVCVNRTPEAAFRTRQGSFLTQSGLRPKAAADGRRRFSRRLRLEPKRFLA